MGKRAHSSKAIGIAFCCRCAGSRPGRRLAPPYRTQAGPSLVGIGILAMGETPREVEGEAAPEARVLVGRRWCPPSSRGLGLEVLGAQT